MSKTNTRAISKLLEAQKILTKIQRGRCVHPGHTFAGELIRLLEKGKPMTVGLEEEGSITFTPAQVRVSKTRVTLGEMEFSLCQVTEGDDCDYELLVLHDDGGLSDPIGVPQKLTLAEAA